MKHLSFIMILFTATFLQAQPFLSISATSKGAAFSLGYLEDQSGIEFSTGYNVHPFKADIPTLFTVSAGKRILLSFKEADNFTITPSIGYAAYSVSDFSNYEKDEVYGSIIQVKKIKAIYGLEIGKDWHLGRLYISANYCNKAFWGIGLRTFIK